MPNFILIGMPASGKSTLGKMAAAALQYNFVDTDDTIMDTYHADLMHLIDQFGIDGFIELESKILQQVQVENTIIATGGSAIYSDAAMQHLKQIGTVIYLKRELSEIAAQVGNLTTRGVVCRNANNLAELYAERCPLYEKYADVVVSLDKKKRRTGSSRNCSCGEKYAQRLIFQNSIKTKAAGHRNIRQPAVIVFMRKINRLAVMRHIKPS